MSGQNRPAGFTSLRIGGRIRQTHHILRCSLLTICAEVIREKVQDGVTGETKEMQYTQCKIVGNGSFGVVFHTKLAPNGEDAAIKRVLQDKRFKVPLQSIRQVYGELLTKDRTASFKLCALSVIPT